MENSFTLRWDDPRSQGNIVSEEVICDIAGVETHPGRLTPDTIIPDVDSEQIAAENLMYLAQDVVGYSGQVEESIVEDGEVTEVGEVMEMECQVTEEVITDDWVQPGGQERVDVPLETLLVVTSEQTVEDDNIDVPLPTDQDEYTAMRPYPCDFCSRRFRKKANLVNHMTAHQNDRPYGCNLCGARYVRRCDLLHHLKTHAYVPEDEEERENDFDMLKVRKKPLTKKVRRRSRLSSENGSFSFSSSFSLDAETSVAARTQQYSGQGQLVNNNTINSTSTAGSSSRHHNTLMPVAEAPMTLNRFSVTDPRRPFVCQHCGVGFAREKALASHARIHGGDSPLECNVCGELCWSREQLATHYRNKHPHRPLPSASSAQDSLGFGDGYSDGSLPDGNDMGSPELTCKDCGAGFQRADLLRRHVKAAHSYKLEPLDDLNDADGSMMDDGVGDNDWEELEHTCGACGEGFKDALDLLAHAESHARNRNNRCVQCGEKFSDEQSMADHVESSHGPISSYTCTRCGRVCRDKKALLKHTQTQHSSVQLSQQLFCSKCGKSFHNKARLKRHMTSHRDKAVACNICGESFTDGRSLMNHRHSHSTSAARQFPCRECGKTFGSRSSQQIHIRIHTGERPYACRFCWKAFADGGTLRKHERIHTGEKPYACAVCPRAFNQRVVLREHVRSHHSAPDSRRGAGGPAFWCAVCGRLLHTSADLVQHLIQHSDANTALKRQPQTGPRKYKRRRKLKPHEMDMFFNRPQRNNSETSLNDVLNASAQGDGDNNEVEEDEDNNSIEQLPEVSYRNEVPVPKRRASQAGGRRGRKSKTSAARDSAASNLTHGLLVPKREVVATGSARTKGKGRLKKEANMQTRPKMIHTQKVKGTTEATSTPTRGRRRCTVASTTTATSTSVSSEERRPRTKNVRYHEPGRPPTATFPSVKMEPDTDIAADLREIFKTPSSPDAPVVTKRERSRRSGDLNSSANQTNFSVSNSNGSSSAVSIKMEEEEEGSFKCEMCSLDFSQRSQLVSHVRIHI